MFRKNINNEKNIFVLNFKKLKKIYNTRNLTGRSRFNLHKNYKSKIQEMIISFNYKSYVEPHYFKKKHTYFRLIKGSFLVRIFKREKVTKKIFIKRKNQILIIYPNTKYDILSLKKNSVIHELMEGPFNKSLFKT